MKKEYEIKITGSGTIVDIVTQLRSVADSIQMTNAVDNENMEGVMEDHILCTKLREKD